MPTYNFTPASRYYGVDTATAKDEDGRTIVYLRRRFLPKSERFALLQEHVVTEGERLDQITANCIGDPEAFWLIADANATMRPEALIEVIGRRIRITLPEGIPGNSDA